MNKEVVAVKRSPRQLDPTWLYLNSAGKAPLLTKDEEVKISREIDGIQRNICKILFEVPALIEALATLGNPAESKDQPRVEEIVRLPSAAWENPTIYREEVDRIHSVFQRLQESLEAWRTAVQEFGNATARGISGKKLLPYETTVQETIAEARRIAMELILNHRQTDRLIEIYKTEAERSSSGLLEGMTKLGKWEFMRNRTKERLVQANVRLVISVAKVYTSSGMELIDLIQEGNAGLIKAVENFDWTKGYKFSTYATWWIKQAITRAIGDKGKTIRIPANMIDIVRKVSRAGRRFVQNNGCEPSAEDLAAETGLPLKKVRMAIDAAQDPVSLDAWTGDDEKSRLGDFIADPNAEQPASSTDRQALRQTLDSVLNELDEKEQAILRMRFGLDDNRPRTLKETGERHGISRERVRQIESKALIKLKHPGRTRMLQDLLDE